MASDFAPDALHPEAFGMEHTPARPGYWTDPKTGIVVEVLANRIDSPANLSGKRFWPTLTPRPPTTEEVAWFKGGEKGLVDYVTDPVALASLVDDFKSAGRTVTSSAASLPQKIEATTRALAPIAAGVAVGFFLPLTMAWRVGGAAAAFLTTRFLERRIQR